MGSAPSTTRRRWRAKWNRIAASAYFGYEAADRINKNLKIPFLRLEAIPLSRSENSESDMGRVIPRGRKPNARRTRALATLLLACGLLTVLPSGLFAQPADNNRTHYVNFRDFNIPFGAMNDPQIAEILLYVSTDRKPYTYVGAVKPSARKFFYPAEGDGWYSFVVQTRSANGVLSPSDLKSVSPSLRICVDTQAPVIEELTAVAPTAESKQPGIHWKIKEENLKEIWLEYRSVNGGDWVPLFPQAEPEKTWRWKPAWGGELEVRMQALDQAGNRSEVKKLRLIVPENVAHMPHPGDAATQGKVIYVKSKTFQLSYKLDDESVGPSKVAAVDIWKVHRGQAWTKCPEKGTRDGPVTISVNSAGRWGFRLIPRSGVGLAERDPRQGDAPDIWVEVDEDAPKVKITNVTVAQEDDGGYMTVYWKAEDTFLRATPISIFLSPTPQSGTWMPIEGSLANTGSWRIKTDAPILGGRYEFYVKVSAIDEAGNVGSDQWREVVKVDLKIPRIKSIDVKPTDAPPPTSMPANNAQETSRQRLSPPNFGNPLGGDAPKSPPPPLGGTPAQPRPMPSSLTGTNGGFSNPTTQTVPIKGLEIP